MRTDDARRILSDKCRHYGLTITANDALTENTTIIMAALSAMHVAFEAGRADAVRTAISGVRETVGPHMHVAGTTIGKDIDECAKCGLDLRNPIHA